MHGVTGGIDALGEVTLRIQEDGKTFLGHGADTDIVVASVKAYVTALNKLVASGPAQAAEVSAQRAAVVATAKGASAPSFSGTAPLGHGLWKQ